MAENTNTNRLELYQTTTAAGEPGQSLRLAQNLFLDELPGIAFGIVTLIWIVASLASLIWRDLPNHLAAQIPDLARWMWASPALAFATRAGSLAGTAGNVYAFVAARIAR